MAYTEDLCEGGIVSASSTYSDLYLPEKAFDNIIQGEGDGSRWGTSLTPSYPEWITYNFGAGNEKIIQKLNLMSHEDGAAYYPTGFIFQGSNDDLSWYDLITVNGLTWSINEIKSYTFDNLMAYRYYRVFITAGSSIILTIGEIEMMEKTDVNPNRSDYVSALFNVKQAKLRSKAKGGYVRPTIAQHFAANAKKHFINILSNASPIANPDSVELSKNSSVIIDLLANDTDPELQPLTVISLAGVVHGSLENHGDGTVTYTPVAEYFGTDSFGYTIEDNVGNTADSTCLITINEFALLTGYTSDQCAGGTATASETGVNYSPNYAFDNGAAPNSTHQWRMTGRTSDGVFDAWLQYQFASSKQIEQIGIWSTYNRGMDPIKDFSVLASNTGAFTGEEVNLGTFQQPENPGDIYINHQFSNQSSFLYYRLFITSNWFGNGNNERGIQQVQMHEGIYA